MEKFFNFLKERSLWLRKEVLKIHKFAREIRIASCLSDIEIFVVLYWGRILNVNPKNIFWEKRDRFIVSKAHGAVALYPLLAEFGFFDKKKLKSICKGNSTFGSIPDSTVPGIETINGSLGHGLGTGCGIAVGLKKKNISAKVFVLLGDGELYEGSVWEAVMFASQHRLDNLIVIVDNNKKSMLDYCKNIIDLSPVEKKFEMFNWKVKTVNGHNVKELYYVLRNFKESKIPYPKILIANTIKGKGVSMLEKDPLCHIKSLQTNEIDKIICGLK